MSTEPALAAGRWRVQLLGGLRARNGHQAITRFGTRAVGALLARLALFPARDHPREELAELLWPGAEPGLSANRLRNALSTLRGLLETPDIPAGTLIEADRRRVRVNADLIDCDARTFEALARQGRASEAAAHYGGELLPGFYDEWIIDERTRLENLYEQVSARAAADGATSAATLAPGALHGAAVARPAPALHALPGTRLRLPSYATSCFGRETEMQLLADAFARHRLVSLVGPAGSGKTRTSLEFAAQAAGFERVAFVALAVCRSPAAVHEHVRLALGLDPAPTPALAQIAAALEASPTLLVLDNLEHLLPRGQAPFVAELLDGVPTVRLLTTSQGTFAQPQGVELTFEPLPLPGLGAAPAEARRSPAVALFVDRAQAARADFRLHEGNVEAVATLCRALDGLPLAIELAASRIRQFAPRALAEQLGRGAGLAQPRQQGGMRSRRRGRHASLDHALAWSWELLNPRQQAAMAGLSEFQAAFDTDAACDVLAATAPAGRALIAALVQRSMLYRMQAGGEAVQFGSLHTVREFVGRQAPESVRREARRRHRRHFLARAQAHGSGTLPIGDDQRPEYLHAIAGALLDDDAAAAAAMALALRNHWASRGAPADAIELLQATADHAQQETLARCELLCQLAALRLDAGRADEALDCAERAGAVAAAAVPRSPSHELEARITAEHVRWRALRDGQASLPAARAVWQAAQAQTDTRLIGRAAMLLGAVTLMHLDDADAAEALFARAEAAFAALRDPRATLSPLPGRVACLLRKDRFEGAIAMATQGVEEARRLHDVQTELLLLNRQAEACTGLDRHAEALQCGRAQARLAHRHALAYHFAYAIWNQCDPLARLGHFEDAARLMAFSSRYWTEHFGPIADADRDYVERVRQHVVRAVGSQRWSALWARGEALALKDGVALGCG